MAQGDYYVDENGDYLIDGVTGDYKLVGSGVECCCGDDNCCLELVDCFGGVDAGHWIVDCNTGYQVGDILKASGNCYRVIAKHEPCPSPPVTDWTDQGEFATCDDCCGITTSFLCRCDTELQNTVSVDIAGQSAGDDGCRPWCGMFTGHWSLTRVVPANPNIFSSCHWEGCHATGPNSYIKLIVQLVLIPAVPVVFNPPTPAVPEGRRWQVIVIEADGENLVCNDPHRQSGTIFHSPPLWKNCGRWACRGFFECERVQLGGASGSCDLPFLPGPLNGYPADAVDGCYPSGVIVLNTFG
jgi:hypothetical protein